MCQIEVSSFTGYSCSTLLFQLPIVPDQPQIRANETKPNPNVTLTLILTLILTLTIFTVLTRRCNMIGRSVSLDPSGLDPGAIMYRAVPNCF